MQIWSWSQSSAPVDCGRRWPRSALARIPLWRARKLSQLSYSDMCFPIQYAVTWPDRVPNTLPPLDFSKLSKLEFFTPRYDDFPALNLARRAGETGGTLPGVMNAANEVAVAAFLDRRVSFPSIWQIVEEVMNRHRSVAHPAVAAILQAYHWARAE